MESDEDDPIPGPSWGIPKVRAKKRFFSEDQKERKRALDRNRSALKRKAERLANPEQFKAKNKARVRMTQSRQRLANPEKFKANHKARMKMTRSRQRLANPEKFKANHKARMKMTRSRQMSSVAAKDGLKSFDITRRMFVIQKLSDTKDAVGFMDKKCEHCGALKFRGETKGFCCSSGKVLPEPFPRPPEELMKLWNSNEAVSYTHLTLPTILLV